MQKQEAVFVAVALILSSCKNCSFETSLLRLWCQLLESAVLQRQIFVSTKTGGVFVAAGLILSLQNWLPFFFVFFFQQQNYGCNHVFAAANIHLAAGNVRNCSSRIIAVIAEIAYDSIPKLQLSSAHTGKGTVNYWIHFLVKEVLIGETSDDDALYCSDSHDHDSHHRHYVNGYRSHCHNDNVLDFLQMKNAAKKRN